MTGLGCVTPLGLDVESSWSAAREGRSGIGAITRFDPPDDFPVRIAGELPGEPDLGDLSAKQAGRYDRAILLAIAAAREAVADAGAGPGWADPERAGVAIGSGIGGIGTHEASHQVLLERGAKRVSPFTIPMLIGNMAAGVVAIQHGLQGPL